MQKVFIKISGDLFENDKVLNWITKYSKNKSVVVCVGGGTQINEALVRAGFPFRKHGILGREHKNNIERNIAEKILNKNSKKVQSTFSKLRVKLKVISPILEIGGVRCHVNGDQMVISAYLGFDELFIITTTDRIKKKQKEFSKYKKIKVIGFRN